MIREAIEKGNICNSVFPSPGESTLGHLYLGSGRMGCSVDRYGLMNTPFNENGVWRTINTAIHHADFWHRGDFGLDVHLPVARVAWEKEEPSAPLYYNQTQNLYDAVTHTVMEWDHSGMEMRTFFHPEKPDILGMDISYFKNGTTIPSLQLLPQTNYAASYNQELSGNWQRGSAYGQENTWNCTLLIGTAACHLGLKVLTENGQVELTSNSTGVSISFNGDSGRHLLLISVGGIHRRDKLIKMVEGITDIDTFASEAADSWHRRWGNSWIEVSDSTIQALWSRSLYYVLCSYGPDKRSPAAPTGWTGNGWGFHFPQDISFIHPALLRLGHIDIAKRIVENYYEFIEDMKSYTQRIYHAEGTMWSWEFPIGKGSNLLSNGFPNWCQFEIHNAAYPAKMAYDTAQFLQDEEWNQSIAWPIIKETARFYASIVSQEPDSLWSIHIEPSMGQDEFGGHNQKNYLCSLFSAQYTLQIAFEMATRYETNLVDTTKWEQILLNGFAFDRLIDDTLGIYKPVETMNWDEEFGKQKHPVQLNPLTFLPIHDTPDAFSIRAFRMRNEICGSMKRSHSSGWTLGSFWLAASHIGDSEGLRLDIDKILQTEYSDKDRIQFFESGSFYTMPYYVTSHGLFLQAVTDAILSDYWGHEQMGAAYPTQWGPVSFYNLHTKFGDVVSGKRSRGKWIVTDRIKHWDVPRSSRDEIPD